MIRPAAEYARVSGVVADCISRSDDREHASRLLMRSSALALMYLAGPQIAAERLYALADEMADAVAAAEELQR